MIPPTRRTFVRFGSTHYVDAQGVGWLALRRGTSTDRELVADLDFDGFRGEVLDFRLPRQPRFGGARLDPPQVGDHVLLYDPHLPLLLAHGVVASTHFDPARSASVGRAVLRPFASYVEE